MSAQSLAEKLTMAGLEVVSLEKLADDWVLEVEVTTNRPDWLSVTGIAREIAALTGKKLRLPQATGYRLQAKTKSPEHVTCSPKPLSIEIEDKKGCPRYIGRVINNVEVRASPDWLKNRLESVGLRPVNNIVDITNFCLLECGQPLHAFDYAKIEAGTIIVRRAKEKEKIITIDGEERLLDSSILVIADKSRPVAIAGIMGSKDTEVSEKTKTVLLESAYFDPLTIRRASQKLDLDSESSYRFERGVDLETVFWASLRAADLFKEFATSSKGGLTIGRMEDNGLKKEKEKKISLNILRLSRVLGKDISVSEVERILRGLSFSLQKKTKGNLEVKVPSFRRDVEEDVDLIEEIARLYGYDKIPLTLSSLREPEGITLESGISRPQKIIQETLLGLGLDEVVSYSLIGRGLLEKINFSIDETLLKISNPLSAEQEFLRPTLIGNLLEVIAHNTKRQMEDLRLFDSGKIYLKKNHQPQEFPCLGLALSGRRYADWLRKTALIDFYDLKGIIEAVFCKLNISEFLIEPKALPCFSAACSVELKIHNQTIGFAGEISELVLKNFDLMQKVFLAELNLEKIFPFADYQKKFSSLPKYPAVMRDISFIVDEKIPYAELGNFFKENRYGLVKEINLVDVFKGGNVPAGKRSLTVSLKYQSPQRTLRDAEIDEIEARIRHGLVERFGAQMR